MTHKCCDVILYWSNLFFVLQSNSRLLKWLHLLMWNLFPYFFRTQSHRCGFGQCWKDNHPVPVVRGLLELWKSCLLLLYVTMFCSRVDSLTKEAVHTSPTIGSNVEQITVRKTHFLVWDIGGQESLRASWYSYYCNTEVRKHTSHVSTNEPVWCW